MENKNLSNKSTFRADSFNLHLFHKGMMFTDNYGLMLGCTKNYAHPPISREELKGLADFIYKYLEHNQ